MPGAGFTGNTIGRPGRCSEKHDMLYSKARFVFNQRHIKRPWFNLNPFLAKIDEKIDLETFQPEEGKHLQRLESLVLCESFQHDRSLDARELPIDDFFKYLYSNEWNAGCSLRVSDGQLLDELLLGLYRMESQGRTVRHSTYAIAKNNRPRHGCYKLANKEAYGSIEETLLLEFSYFGRLTKDRPNSKTLNTFEYLPKQLTEENYKQYVEEGKAELEERHTQYVKECKADQISSDGKKTRKPMNLSLPQPKVTLKQGKSGHSQFTLSANAVRFITSLGQETRRKSAVPTKQPWFKGATPLRLQKDIKDFLERRRDGFQGKTFPRERYNVYSPESDDDDDDFDEPEPSTSESESEESSSEDEKDKFFGEELYLSEMNSQQNGPPMSAKEILRRKKIELHERRDRLKQEKAVKSKMTKPLLPPLPPLKRIEFKSTITYETIRMPDHVPSFEEFIKILKEDEFYDPRYRNKLRMKSRRLARRYYMSRSIGRSFMLGHGNAPSDIYSSGRQSPVCRKKRKGFQAKESKTSGFLKPKESCITSELSPSPPSGHNLALEVPEIRRRRQRHAQEVHGVTDSEPCKHHYYREREYCSDKYLKPFDDRWRDTEHKYPDGKEHRRSLIPDQHAIGNRRSGSWLDVKPHSTCSTSESKSSSRLQVQGPVCFARPSSHGLDSETTESSLSSETDSDEDQPSSFNADKLNLRYSFERLNKKRKSRAVKKKPAFFSILSKYYKMHNITSRLLKTPLCPKKSKQIKPMAQTQPLLGMFKRPKKVKQEIVVGKLKHFSFLDKAKPAAKLDLSSISVENFYRPNLKRFHKQLARALDDFVVRRETVVSSLHSFFNTATTVTFTKTSCCEKQHKH